MKCYGIVEDGATWRQELYETASHDAGRRARELRKLGYRVTVSALGPQVTRVGRIAMSAVTIWRLDGQETPWHVPDVRLVTI